MKLEDAIQFWVDENGFRQIQAEFSKRQHGNIRYAQSNLISNKINQDKVVDAIETIKDSMISAEKPEIYYRGISLNIKEPHIREGFFSVTRDPKKAETYGNVYKVIVSKEVPRISFLAEGDETLLSDGMVYEYSKDSKTIYVRTPQESNILPFLGNLYKRQKNIKNTRAKESYGKIIDKLYCYSFEEPNVNVGYIGDCNENNKNIQAFKTKSIGEKIDMIKLRINRLLSKQKFINDISFIISSEIGDSQENIKNIISEIIKMTGGNYKKTRRNKRKFATRRRRT